MIVPESEIKLLGIIPGSITIIISATAVLITAIAAVSDLPRPTKVLLISTMAGAGMGAGIGTSLGPAGTAVGGLVGAAAGLAIGVTSLFFNNS